MPNPEEAAHLRTDLRMLSERARLVNRAIGMATFGALLVCLVIVALFVSAVADTHLGEVIAIAFTGAMLALIGALVNFLRRPISRRGACVPVRSDRARPGRASAPRTR